MNMFRGPNDAGSCLGWHLELAASTENGREGQGMLRGRAPGCGVLDETHRDEVAVWHGPRFQMEGAVDDRWVLVGNRFQLPSLPAQT